MILTVTFNPAIDKTAEVDVLVPGGLNRLKNVRQDAGGKGINVSKTIKAFGKESCALGFLAGNAGQFIEQTLNGLHIEHDFVQVEGDTRTNLKVLDHDMELTELNEAGPFVRKEDIEKLIAKIKEKSDDSTYVVLSGNVGPGVPSTIYKEITKELKGQGIHVLLDADGELFKEGIKARPEAIKPNRFELVQYFGVEEPRTVRETADLGRKLLNEETKLVVISMGKDGAIFLTDEKSLYVPSLKVKIHSSVGAGDAMVAAIAYALEQDMPLEQLARFAVACSAGACMTEGTQPAQKEQIEQLENQVEIENI